MSYYISSADLVEETKNLEEELKDFIKEGFEEDEFDDIERLEELRDVNERGAEMFGLDLWNSGLTLIEEDDFEDYAREYVEDCYNIPDSILCYIDWESFSNDLKQDFQTVEYNGCTYYVRD